MHHLPEPLRRRAERILRTDLSTVRIHIEPRTAGFGALALTCGEDIFFTPGCYEPATPWGQRLIGHELAHVVQQRAGRVASTDRGELSLVHDEALEADADQVGAMLAQGGVAPRLELRSLRPSAKRAARPSVLQAKIPVSFTDWLRLREVGFSHGALAQYMYYFEVEEELKWAGVGMRPWELAALSKAKLPQATIIANIDALVGRVDTALNDRSFDPFGLNKQPQSRSCDQDKKKFWEYPNHYESEWKANVTWGGADLWDDYDAALAALNALVAASRLGTEAGGRFVIEEGDNKKRTVTLRFPKIAFSQLKNRSGNFPAHLRRLMRDIYWSWKAGGYLDERTAPDQTNKRVVNTPGSLRSWHMNQKGTLKDIGDDALPGTSQAFHDHYRNTSKLENNVQQNVGQVAVPIGYAEYTGTGIINDVHNCKMVLDYKNDLFYLCVTHYQFWTEENGDYTRRGQTFREDYNPPWFCIDFER